MASTLNLGAVKTPGVYIDEMSLFPPSVAQVDTAIPAFIGPTEQHSKDGQSVQGVPTKISSMVEYRRYFGGAPARQSTVTLDASNAVAAVAVTPGQYLFDSLTLFFANGGEKCYIVSTGTYGSAPPSIGQVEQALEALRQYDEPTLIVMPDAVRMAAPAAAQQAILSHCQAMQDRFAILDVKMTNPSSSQLNDTDIETFRSGVTDYQDYGAAYYPYVHTSLPLTVSFADLALQRKNNTPVLLSQIVAGTAAQGLASKAEQQAHEVIGLRTALPIRGEFADASNPKQYLTDKLNALLGMAAADPATGSSFINDPVTKAEIVAIDENALQTTINGMASTTAADVYNEVAEVIGGIVRRAEVRLQAREAEMKATIPVYAAIVAAVESQGIVVPPSGAVAGVYARVDTDRGVWKSPANVGLSYVTGPVVRLTDRDQEGLNVDPDTGKSINAIRAFTGKGTLVWGARTLAGSDNEWRYVAVRRFFLMVEESIKKATGQFVFEANDANTWVRVRAMIENFLTLQWRAGALAGTKAENAFFVRVGLGQTMTPEDVLNGFLIVEIGMAVVRPAEFIVLRFSHKMQEA